MKRIYLDYASLTPVDKGVLKLIKKYSNKKYTNPSALYSSAVMAKEVVKDAYNRVAAIIHAHTDEIIFTSGGTESNQLVLDSVIGKHIIVSAIEHSSIIQNSKATQILVDNSGLVDLDLLKTSITAETVLVSIIMVNNEIGVIQPIHEIAKIVRDARKKFNTKIHFHVDASQAIVHFPLYVEKLGIDLMTLDGNKIYGPRGIGMLYVKRDSVKIFRPGTLNVPSIAGFAYALYLVEKMREKETARIVELKDFFIKELHKINKEIRVNGNLEKSSPHILNVSIPNTDNEFFILQLDAKGIECSTKSACLRDEDESYVLKAIGSDSKVSVRFSFGRGTKKGELKKVVKAIEKILYVFG